MVHLNPNCSSPQICHPSGAAITGQLIQNSRVVMVEKCGHAMTMDRPRKCAKLVSDFIREQTSAGIINH